MSFPLPSLDELIVAFDRGLRTVFAPARSSSETPGADLPEAGMTDAERRESAALMRVNHTGEVCAQALYQGQALTARERAARAALDKAAQEETDHLAWTERRIAELGGRPSALNAAWYAGSFAIGALAGLAGDRWSLGFLAETERQVVAHLDGHLRRLPHADRRSRAIVERMRADESRHATSAMHYGGRSLPGPARAAMRVGSRIMTGTTYWI